MKTFVFLVLARVVSASPNGKCYQCDAGVTTHCQFKLAATGCTWSASLSSELKEHGVVGRTATVRVLTNELEGKDITKVTPKPWMNGDSLIKVPDNEASTRGLSLEAAKKDYDDSGGMSTCLS